MADPDESIDCRRAHELLSRQMDAPLTPAEWALLRAHLVICDLCVLVQRQFQALRSAVRKFGA